MLKLIKLTVIFLLLAGANFAQSPFLTLMADDGVSYEAETLAYQLRVEADGGEVIDIDAVNNFYVNAKANDYLDTLTTALIFTGGVKISGAVITKWYDLSLNENDFITYYGLNPNYSLTDGVGDGTTPDFGQSLAYNQPNSYYFIMKANGLTGSEAIWGGAGYQLFYEGTTHKVAIYAGGTVESADTYTNNTHFFCRAIFNGASSSVQLNGGTPTTGNAGAQNVSTDFLFFNTIENIYIKAFIITPMLSTTKDLALKNILNTIYPTY